EFQAKQERLKGIRGLLEKTRVSSEMLGKLDALSSSCKGGLSGAEAQSPNDPDGTAEAVPFPSLAVPSSERRTEMSASPSNLIGSTLAQLLKRPEISIEQMAPVLRELASDFFAREARSGSLTTNHQPLTTS